AHDFTWARRERHDLFLLGGLETRSAVDPLGQFRALAFDLRNRALSDGAFVAHLRDHGVRLSFPVAALLDRTDRRGWLDGLPHAGLARRSRFRPDLCLSAHDD